MKLRGVARSHGGLLRAKNEDAFFVDDELGMYAVADGMGGAARGEVASRMVIDAVTEYIRRFVETGITDPARYDYYDSDLSPRANTLLQAVHLANRLVFDIAQADSRHRGMGATLATLMLDEDDALIAHVGDSRVYLFRAGRFAQLTADHRLTHDLKRRGLQDTPSVAAAGLENVLTRAMGSRGQVSPELRRIPLEDDDLFLICSDGLSDMVREDMIGEVLAMNRSVPQKANDLIELALANGGRDNVTVILVAVEHGRRLKSLLNMITKSN